MDYDADPGGVDRGEPPSDSQYIQSDIHYVSDESDEIEKISHFASKAGIITAWVVAITVLLVCACCAGGLLLNYAFGH